MQKKILWLIKKEMPYFDLIREEAKKQQVNLVFCLYSEVRFSYQNGTTQILVDDNSLDSYQLVYFRNIDPFLEKHITIAAYCQTNHIAILDKALEYKRPWIISKSHAYLRFVEKKLPIIDTEYLSKSLFSKLKNQFSYPLITKITDGAQGEGVHLCQNAQEVLDLFDHYQEDLLIQKYIENDGDIRAFVLGNKVVAAMKRTSSSPDEFRNNISLGGKAEQFSLSQSEQDLAVQACQALEYCNAGVDLLFDSVTQKWVILEVNKAPQFLGLMEATRINIPEKIVSFFAEELSKLSTSTTPLVGNEIISPCQ